MAEDSIKVAEVNLKEKVLRKIEETSNNKAFYRKLFSLPIIFFSFIFILFFVYIVINQVSNSGFYNYISLIFTDSRLILDNLGDFSFTLLDSIPFFEITVIIGLILSGLFILRFVVSSRIFKIKTIK